MSNRFVLNTVVKSVGLNGQISLGKKFAGMQVLLIELEDGTLVVQPGKFVPDSELWLHRDGGKKRLENALHWYENTHGKRRDNFAEIAKKIKDA